MEGGLNKLKSKGYRLFAFSNGKADDVETLLVRAGIIDYFFWIVSVDSMQLCPDDDNLAQRYILALLYYETNGEKWTRCGADSETCDDGGDVHEQESFIQSVQDSGAGSPL